MSNPTKELADLLRELDVPVQIGLRQQGHIPTVERMLAEGKTWDEIGAAIGWHGPTVAEWYEADQRHQRIRQHEAARIRRALLATMVEGKAPGWIEMTVADARALVDRLCPEDGSTPACDWTEQENGPWETSCGGVFDVNDGPPSENRMRFCCYCGRPLAEKRFEPEPERKYEDADADS